MLEIFFGSPKEAKTIYSIFLSMCKGLDSELQLLNQRSIKINPKTWDISLEQIIIPGLVQFIIEYKERQILVAIIKEKYYFLVEEEQQQIIHIAQSIIEGERKNLPRAQKLAPRDDILRTAFEQFLRPDLHFSFTSFQKFRLHEYREKLREYVEVAIEEYKLEQEYQSFIQSLRDYLAMKKCVVEWILIVHEHNKGYYIFKRNKQKIPEHELKKYIDNDFVDQHPMEIDSDLLAPIVSMAPNRISLYTNDPFDGMVQTIQNIFQERVDIHSYHEFSLDVNHDKK